jgi:hypothetical protein
VSGSLSVEEARRQAEAMNPAEQQQYLLGEGIDDGAAEDRARVLAKVRATPR